MFYCNCNISKLNTILDGSDCIENASHHDVVLEGLYHNFDHMIKFVITSSYNMSVYMIYLFILHLIILFIIIITNSLYQNIN